MGPKQNSGNFVNVWRRVTSLNPINTRSYAYVFKQVCILGVSVCFDVEISAENKKCYSSFHYSFLTIYFNSIHFCDNTSVSYLKNVSAYSSSHICWQKFICFCCFATPSGPSLRGSGKTAKINQFFPTNVFAKLLKILHSQYFTFCIPLFNMRVTNSY